MQENMCCAEVQQESLVSCWLEDHLAAMYRDGEASQCYVAMLLDCIQILLLAKNGKGVASSVHGHIIT
jgi:hypothetical protein